jgi:type I restriction enzyme R subunit
MQEKFEVAAAMLHGFDYSLYLTGTPAQRLGTLGAAVDHVLGRDDGKARFLKAVSDLSKAFALAVPHEGALALRDHIRFFQATRAVIAKTTATPGRDPEDLDVAVRQIVSRAVVSDEVVDLFAAAGLQRPDISILSDEFLEEVRDLPHRNVALEVLRKLLNDEIATRSRTNLVQARSFAEMLEKTIRQYQNRSLETAEVIAELIELAKEMRAAHGRGEQKKLSDEELAFYDALETNDSAVAVLGDETLKGIARELVDIVRRNVTIDWTLKESARANLRRLVKHLLRKHGYPPDKQEKATLTVLEQAETLCRDWAA